MTYISTIQASLSVGQLAAVVNGLLLFLQSLVSSAFAIPLYGFSDDHQHDNDVVRRIMQNTLWPLILVLFRPSLGTDKRWERIKKSTSGTIWPFGIVVFVRGIALFCTVSIIVGGFLVPLPLDYKFSEGYETETDFFPLQDKSFFGRGTLGIPSPAMTRRCSSDGTLRVCPGATGNISTISEEYKSQFGAVMSKHHLPSPFDVRYRTWYLSKQYAQDTQPLERQPIGDMNPITSHVLDDSYVLIDGLILDTIHGGVGLRNHTGPSSRAHGATWSEPILWLTPLTECVSTNLSFHYTYFSASNISDGYLQDDGGFANAAPPEPFESWYEYGWNLSTGNIPDLKKSAYNTAWWSNNITQRMMKIPKPEKVGTRYANRLSSYFEDFVSPGTLITSDANVGYIDLIATDVEEMELSEAFKRIGLWKCSGYNEDREDATGIKPFVRCGYLFTMPYAKGEQGHKLRFDEGSKWQQELYTCASAVKASIKAVTFKSDGGQSLDNITVTDVQNILSTEDNGPLWGLEVPEGFKIASINRIWGLMSNSYNGLSSFMTARTSELFLPASSLYSFLFTAQDLFAGGSVFQTAWNDVFRHAAAFAGALRQIPNYRGDDDYALALKWRELSQTPEGGALVCKLIWTDLVAFALTSGQTGFPAAVGSGVPPGSVGRRMVIPYITMLVYNQFWYSIMAIIATFLVLLGIIMTIFMFMFSKSLNSRGKIKRDMTLKHISEFLGQEKGAQTVLGSPGSKPTSASDSTPDALVDQSSDRDTQNATTSQSTDGNAQNLTHSSNNSSIAESAPDASAVPESSPAPDPVGQTQENQGTATGTSYVQTVPSEQI